MTRFFYFPLEKYLIALAISLTAITVNASTLVGHVVAVYDGDTITVIDATHTQYKIRLAGIDAPEKKQAFGKASKKSLSDFVFDKVVSIEYTKRDRYNRIVGKVNIAGQDINLKQIENGMAWFYKKYQKELILSDRLNYLHAQQVAEAEKIGLWVEEPIAPWDFRKGARN